jgi:replicative DNA helicase
MARTNTDPAKAGEPKLPEGKLPPQNLDAEVSLLGAALIDEGVLTRVSDKLSADDFYDKRHQIIFSAMLRLYEHNNPVDLLTLSDELKKKGELDNAGGAQYLTDLSNQVPTAAHAEHYAQIITQNAVRRRLIGVSSRIAELGFDESRSPDELLEVAEAQLFTVSDKALRQDLASLEQILTESFDRMEELHRNKDGLRGIRTGWRDLDNLTAGLQRSDLVIVGARPAMGKTTLLTNLAYNVASVEKQAVLFFNLEMSKEQLVDRMLAEAAGVDAWNIRTGKLTDDDFEKISNAMGEMAEAPVFIDDTPGLSVLELRTKARRFAHEHPLGMIIIDYLQLMQGSGRGGSSFDNRVQEISEISRGLKLIARELNVPVIAAAQLSRSVESRNPPIPQLSDLRESGSIEQDADIVSFIYREDYYNPETERQHMTDLIIAKHRNGPTGKVELFFHPERLKFMSLDKKHS